MRRVTVVCAVAAVLLSGCGDGDGPSAQGASTGAPVSDGGVIEPTGTSGLPSGIMVSKKDFSTDTTVFQVYDIGTGNLLTTAAAPGVFSGGSRQEFDATMHRLAYVADCALHVATLNDSMYVPSARWQPPQAFGEGKQCFNDPAFGEDGRVRATVRGNDFEPGRVMSVNPDEPDSAPRDEGAGSLRKEKLLRISGLKESDVRVYVAGDRITDLLVSGLKPGGDWITGNFSYKCNEHVDATSLLCTSSLESARQYYGSVALATVDLSAGTVTVKQVAPASESSRLTALSAPDGNRVAIRDSTGWYVTSIDGDSSPTRQPLSDQQIVGETRFWA